MICFCKDVEAMILNRVRYDFISFKNVLGAFERPKNISKNSYGLFRWIILISLYYGGAFLLRYPLTRSRVVKDRACPNMSRMWLKLGSGHLSSDSTVVESPKINNETPLHCA